MSVVRKSWKCGIGWFKRVSLDGRFLGWTLLPYDWSSGSTRPRYLLGHPFGHLWASELTVDHGRTSGYTKGLTWFRSSLTFTVVGFNSRLIARWTKELSFIRVTVVSRRSSFLHHWVRLNENICSHLVSFKISFRSFDGRVLKTGEDLGGREARTCNNTSLGYRYEWTQVKYGG